MKCLNEVTTITVLSNVFEFWKQRSGEFRAGGRAVDLGGPKFKIKHRSHCLQKSKLADWRGASMSIGRARPPLAPAVSKFPALFKLFKYLLHRPTLASSAPVERNFSTSGLIMRPQRARLSLEMLEILVYLKFNFLEK